MLEFFRRLPLFVIAGRVACRTRGRDVDIETCAGCDALDGIADQDGEKLVYCHRRDDRTLSLLTYPR